MTVMIAMPTSIGLDDVAAMGEADEAHRYEFSAEGELKVMMTASPEHSRIVMRLVAWLLAAGYSAESLRTDMGIYTGGGRQPDLTIWYGPAPSQALASVYVAVDGLAAVVEVISPGSRRNDTVDKISEYASAGIARFWLIEQDASQPVTMHTLANGGYVPAAPVPLEWLLSQDPHRFLD